ncbi:MAG: 16S rRNA (cytosine(967)-C(5))-methyltransferase [Cyanobacteria bacterium P01_H01_bin.15]
MTKSAVYSARRVAWLALKDVHLRQAYADLALDRQLRKQPASFRAEDRALATELVYGTVRRQRTLDTLIDQLGKRKAIEQPPALRVVLQLGLYQLRYLNQIPPHAAVAATVELAKQVGLSKLSGVVNGMLRQYLRLTASTAEPLILPESWTARLAIQESFPDWLITHWSSQLSETETVELCRWFNQAPALDLRVNPLRAERESVNQSLRERGLNCEPIPHLPQGLRLKGRIGNIQTLPGYREGQWSVQDASAQLVSHLVDPQPGETIVDACAAPGGKTTHLSELMGNKGRVWGCDYLPQRLKHIQTNQKRLQLDNIRTQLGDSCAVRDFDHLCDRVLVDAPCSGLGTLHRRPDIRWRQTPQKFAELSQLQLKLINNAARWVKPKGILVYSTCTLNPQENEEVVTRFLQTHPDWSLIAFPPQFRQFSFQDNSTGTLILWPQRQDQDGFFIARFRRQVKEISATGDTNF